MYRHIEDWLKLIDKLAEEQIEPLNSRSDLWVGDSPQAMKIFQMWDTLKKIRNSAYYAGEDMAIEGTELAYDAEEHGIIELEEEEDESAEEEEYYEGDEEEEYYEGDEEEEGEDNA